MTQEQKDQLLKEITMKFDPLMRGIKIPNKLITCICNVLDNARTYGDSTSWVANYIDKYVKENYPKIGTNTVLWHGVAKKFLGR